LANYTKFVELRQLFVYIAQSAGRFSPLTVHRTGTSHDRQITWPTLMHAYVNATVYVFLRVKNVSDEIFEEEQNPVCMSGALRVEVTLTPQVRYIFFSKAFDVLYIFRSLGRLPKIQKPK
jgi:hypothetical protein